MRDVFVPYFPFSMGNDDLSSVYPCSLLFCINDRKKQREMHIIYLLFGQHPFPLSLPYKQEGNHINKRARERERKIVS
jgi:hypothetical protein